MPCAEFEDRLIDLAEFSEAERRSLDAHLAACPSCREYFDALKLLDQALTASFSDVAAPTSSVPGCSLASNPLHESLSCSTLWVGWHERGTVDMTPWAFAAVGALLVTEFWVSLRSLAKSES